MYLSNFMRRNYNNNKNFRRPENRYYKQNFRTNPRTRNRKPAENVSRVTRVTTINRRVGKKNFLNRNRVSTNFNKISSRIDDLSKKIKNLDLKFFPKVTDTQPRKSKKEPRIDKPITPMNMALTTRYISIFKTNNKFKYMPNYSKINIEASSNAPTNLFIFPYFLPFSEYTNDNAYGLYQDKLVNASTNIATFTDDQNNPYVTACTQVGRCGLYGNYRLVGATIKVTNVTEFASRSGTYTCYRLTDNLIHPLYYNSSFPPNQSNRATTQLIKSMQTLVRSPKDNLITKMNYAANDRGLINEFNIYEGNNVFQTPWEYLGLGIEHTSPSFTSLWTGNPAGSPISYLIEFPQPPTSNSYIIEMWQIFEIVPDPTKHLQQVAETQKYVYNDEAITEMQNMPIFKRI